MPSDDINKDCTVRPATPAPSFLDNLSEEDLLLTRREVATFLRCSVPTLERWAALGGGPPFRILGKKAVYPLAGVKRFARGERPAAAA